MNPGLRAQGQGQVIEPAIYFAIGFLVASLAAVVLTPVASRRARRLAEARARLQAPLSERQAIAERDALRAEHAVAEARLERRMTLAEEAAIALRAELGHRSVRIVTLEADAAEQSSLDFDRRARIEALESQCRDLEVAMGASQIAIHDLVAQRDKAHAAEAAAAARQIELEAEASRIRAKAAIMAARAESLEGRYDHHSRSAKTAAEGAEAVRAELARALSEQSERALKLEERLREALALNESLREGASRGDGILEDTQRRLADLESRLAFSERVREETLLENGRQLAVLADREAALRAAQARAVELDARLAQAGADARAEHEVVSRENDALRAKIAELSASAIHAAEDAALRESIERLGREVTRLFAVRKAAKREDPAPSGRFPFAGPEAGVLVDPSSDGRPAFAEGAGRRAVRSRAPDR
jgi:chromosome segregation ATPase